MLFESSLGYALFWAHYVYDVERNYKAIEMYINSFDKVFERIAYHPFGSANAMSNGIFLDEFIERARIIPSNPIFFSLKVFIM